MKNAQKHKEFENVTVESLDAAAALTGYERESLQSWKRMGCPAFKTGNRINLPELQMWLVDNPEAERKSSPVLIMAQLEIRDALIKQANNEQKLSERRKMYAKFEDVTRTVAKSWLAMKLKLLSVSAKLCQPLSMVSDPRVIQQAIEVEHCSALSAIERGEWFNADEVAAWLASQPEILKRANELAAKK